MSKRGKSRGKKGKGEKESMAYKVLSPDDTKMLSQIDDVDELQEKLAAVLKMETHHTDLKDSACVDYYVAGYWWSKEQSFTHEQMSAFFTVIHTVLQNIRDKQMTVVDNLKEFKKMLVGIGQETPEISGGLDCFDISQAKLITDYMASSVFQHYKLYEFMFSTNQAEEIIGTDLEIETPKAADMPWPPPLEESVQEDVYQAYIATPPATPVPQAAEDGQEEGEGDDKPEGELAEDTQREADLLAQLSPEEVKDIMDGVFKEMLGGLQTEIASKLRDKENSFISRINKIHKVPE